MSVSTPEHRAKCGTRYPARCHRYARELWKDGHTVPEIRERLAAYGYHPTPAMIHRWCRPEVRMAVNAAKRRGPKVEPETADSILTKRFRDLRRIGLSYRDISAIFQLDYGVDLNEDRLRYAARQRGGEIRVKARDLAGVPT